MLEYGLVLEREIHVAGGRFMFEEGEVHVGGGERFMFEGGEVHVGGGRGEVHVGGGERFMLEGGEVHVGGGDCKRESPDFGSSGWHLWVCNKQPRLERDLRGKLL